MNKLFEKCEEKNILFDWIGPKNTPAILVVNLTNVQRKSK